MPTNAFGQQVYDPNATGRPLGQGGYYQDPFAGTAINFNGPSQASSFSPQQGQDFLSQLQQMNANRPQSGGSNAYNWSNNGWLNDMNSTAGQNASGGMGMLQGAMPSVDQWTQGFQGGNGDQVRSSVAPLSQGPTQNTNAQQMGGSQSAPQDRYGSAYESNPNVTWSYGGQTTVNPLDRGQFLTQGAAQSLAGQLGQGYTNNAWQLGGPAAYSAPMQTINNLHNAGLVQQMVDRGMPIDQVRSQLDREAAMARGGTQTTLNNPGQAQSESERMYQSMGLVRGADGQWRTPQNAQQTGAANGPPQASPSQQQRYGPLVSAMQQERLRPGYERMGGTNMDGPRPNNSNAAMPQIDWAQRMQNPNFGRNELYGGGLGTDQPLINPETGMSYRDQFSQEQADPRQQQRTQLFQEIANNPNIDRRRSGDPNYLRSVAPDLYARLQESNRSFGPGPSDAQDQRGGGGGQAMSDPGEQRGVDMGMSGNYGTPEQMSSNLGAAMNRYGQQQQQRWNSMSPEQQQQEISQMNSDMLTGQTGGLQQGGGGFRNAMFGQRLGQYGQGMAGYGSNILFGEGGSRDERGPSPNYGGWGGGYQSGRGADNLSGYATGGGAQSQFPSMQQVRGGQANNLGYDPYYYGPQARGPQARQPGWQYPQNTGAFQLYNHGSQESNDLSAFNQRMQQQEQASMPAAWRTAQSAGRSGGGGSWDWNQGARAY